jgi:phosphinothricin acetyltransferase
MRIAFAPSIAAPITVPHPPRRAQRRKMDRERDRSFGRALIDLMLRARATLVPTLASKAGRVPVSVCAEPGCSTRWVRLRARGAERNLSEIATDASALIVRLATPEDVPAITRIYNQGIEDRVATFETEPRTEDRIASMLAEHGSTHPVLVATRDGLVIAWASASTYRPRACYAGVAEASAYVERGARRSGAGSAVFEALCFECEARGFWKLVGRIFADNLASRALCGKLGFVEVGVYRRHGKLDGVWKDCVIVEKLLGDAKT